MYTYISRAWTSYRTEDKEEKSQTRKCTYVLLLPRNTMLRIKEKKREYVKKEKYGGREKEIEKRNREKEKFDIERLL